MGFDLGHTISSLSKLTLRTKRRIDKDNESNIKIYELWLDRNYRACLLYTSPSPRDRG